MSRTDDLIRREDAIDVLIETIAPPSLTLDTLVMRIDSIPSAQPKRGEWVPHKLEKGYDSIDKDVCSECGGRFNDAWLFNFCPNCGAKMDGERKESD